VPVLKGAKPSTSAINGQIIGGTKASQGMFPFQANLIMDSSSLCGGSLIHPTWILSAAHCVYGYKTVLQKIILKMKHFLYFA